MNMRLQASVSMTYPRSDIVAEIFQELRKLFSGCQVFQLWHMKLPFLGLILPTPSRRLSCCSYEGFSEYDLYHHLATTKVFLGYSEFSVHDIDYRTTLSLDLQRQKKCRVATSITERKFTRSTCFTRLKHTGPVRGCYL